MKQACVLVVDDKESVLNLLRAFLEPDFRVETASSARSALERALRDDVDLVLADVRMPDLSGFELLDVLKRDRPGVEVVLMSAFGGTDGATRALRAGAADYLSKPFDQSELRTKVEKAIGRRPPRPHAKLAELSYKEAMTLAHASASRQYLLELMEAFRGNVSVAAERAGMERESLHRLLRRFGIRSRSFRRLN
jgi:DNA-binding NtrC family response regulator